MKLAEAEFVSQDGRRVMIPAPPRGDLDAFLKVVNAISREKAVNRELGILALRKR